MTPAQYARNAHARLRAAGTAERAASSRRFFKQHEKISFYGVAVPDTRRIEREAYNTIRGEWELADAVELANLMIEARQFEAKLFALLTIRRFKKQFDRRLLRTAAGWLRANHCDNWAAVDALCPYVITPLLATFPELVPRVQGWARSKNLWVRRAAVVTFVPLARRGDLLDSAYEVVESLLTDHEDLIHKASGWLLREAGKTDAKRLEAFLLRHGPEIPRTTVRYAIERFPEGTRRWLLEETAG